MWQEQRSHLCNLIAWESVEEQQRVVDSCDRVLAGSARDQMQQVRYYKYSYIEYL